MNIYITICQCAVTTAMFVSFLESAAARKPKPTTMSPWDIAWDRHYNQYKGATDDNSVPFERNTRLYSKASTHHVQVINGTVNGLGKEASEFAKLTVESDTFGRVKIRGVKTNRYLCMNKHGRLVGRKKAGAKEKRRKCIFKERTSKGYRVYESVKYPNWFIAINRNGRAVPGPLSTRGKRSRLFLSREYSGENAGQGDANGRARAPSRRRRMKKLKRILQRRRRRRKQRSTLGYRRELRTGLLGRN